MLVTFVLMLSLSGPALSKDAPHTKSIHRSGSKTLPDLFTEELRLAKAQKKRVLVMFTADWCTPCKIIKEFMAESKRVQAKMRTGRMLIIDVDEWRGPAHRLIPGSNPRKLPLLVRVDTAGKRVVSCYGSDLGLLSGETVGENLARLLDGKLPEKGAYERDPELRRKLIREQVRRSRARHKGKAAVSVRVKRVQASGPLLTLYLDITLRNQTNRRRWYVIGEPGQALSDMPNVDSWELVKFQEHVRASYTRYYGAPGFTLLAVAANGFVDLQGWVAQASRGVKTLEIWQLDTFTVDSKPARFAKKVPYELTVTRAGKTRVLRKFEGQPRLHLKSKNRYTTPLQHRGL